MKRYTFIIVALLLANLSAMSQYFQPIDYKKAGWMVTRMYGGQRSGEGPNWLIQDHNIGNYTGGRSFLKDADGSHSLTGGWFDCGDHVKFGQTEFYAAYVLLKGFAEFPAGYDDYYSYDYAGYHAAGDYSWEGGKGIPNGIPDILDEVRYACEYFIKCAPNGSTFYSQVGNADADHQQWVTAPKMSTNSNGSGGEANGPRDIVRNPNDASMPSFCAATLALMSRVYAQYDPDFAATCLTHAKYAYNYAKSKLGNSQSAPGFYPANVHTYDDYVCANAELYWTTNDESYKSTALANASKVKDHNWCFGYNNNDDIAAYNLALLGSKDGEDLLYKFVQSYTGNVNGDKIFKGGDTQWGPMRNLGNTAYIVALYSKLKGITTYDNFIYNQIDYLLGKNSPKISFIVGMAPAGCTFMKNPHHRNVYLSDANNDKSLTLPSRNTQHGFLIGGKFGDPAGSGNANPSDYTITEGGLDYQAGLVGAFGYINSKLSPIDPNKFGHPSPDLGETQTLCGSGKVIINATVNTEKLETGEILTYKWFKDDVEMGSNANKTRIEVTAAGTYKCEITSSLDWKTSGSVEVTAQLPDITIGKDAELCKISSVTYGTTVEGTGLAYQWYKNNVAIDGATNKNYTVYSAGTYKLTLRDESDRCASKSSEVTVTSKLPEVINGSICAAGSVELAVAVAGDYEWYDVEDGGTALGTGQTYTANINATKTYYVQSAESSAFVAGPKTSDLNSPVNWGDDIAVRFNAKQAMQITGITISVGDVYNQGNQTVTAKLSGDASGEFTSSINLTSSGWKTISFENNPIIISKAGSYELKFKFQNAGINFYPNGPAYSTYQGDKSIIEFTGASNGTASNNPIMGFADWQISSGSGCVRTPVLAIIDPSGNCETPDTEAPTAPGKITVSNITTSSAQVQWIESFDNVDVVSYDVYVNGTKSETVTTNSISLTGLSANTEYTIKINATDEAGNVSSFSANETFTTNKETETQTISLTVGWNLISFYVLPENASVENVFGATNMSKIAIIKNDDGFYKPNKAAELQSLNTIKFGEAYLVKVTTAFNLSVEGFAPTSAVNVNLKKGWNLVGFPKATEATAQTELSGIWAQVAGLKDLQSAQTKFTPGKGYYINVKSATTASFK